MFLSYQIVDLLKQKQVMEKKEGNVNEVMNELIIHKIYKTLNDISGRKLEIRNWGKCLRSLI